MTSKTLDQKLSDINEMMKARSKSFTFRAFLDPESQRVVVWFDDLCAENYIIEITRILHTIPTIRPCTVLDEWVEARWFVGT